MSGCIAFIILFLFALGLSWILTCGILYAIAWCFSLVFSWQIATGIWLVLFLLSLFFGSKNHSKK